MLSDEATVMVTELPGRPTIALWRSELRTASWRCSECFDLDGGASHDY